MKVLSVLLVLAAGASAAGPETAAEWNESGVRLFSQAKYPDAETAFRNAVEQWRKDGPGAALNLAHAMGNLGCSLRAQGRYPEAETLLTESLHRLETLSGPESADAAQALQYMGALYRERGDPAKAEAFLLRAEHIYDAQAAGSPGQAANRQLLASAYLDQGRTADAETLLKPLVEQGGLAAVFAWNGLASAALDRHDAVTAERYARQALDLALSAHPAAGEPLTAAVLNNLAQAYRFQYRYIEAEKTYRRALQTLESAFGSSHPNVARTLTNLAGMYHEMGYEETAERLYRRAIAILDQAFGKNSALAAAARTQLAAVVRAERQPPRQTVAPGPAAFEPAPGPSLPPRAMPAPASFEP